MRKDTRHQEVLIAEASRHGYHLKEVTFTGKAHPVLVFAKGVSTVKFAVPSSGHGSGCATLNARSELRRRILNPTTR